MYRIYFTQICLRTDNRITALIDSIYEIIITYNVGSRHALQSELVNRGKKLFYIFNILVIVYKRHAIISGDGAHTEKSRMQRCCYTFMQNKSDQK